MRIIRQTQRSTISSWNILKASSFPADMYLCLTIILEVVENNAMWLLETNHLGNAVCNQVSKMFQNRWFLRQVCFYQTYIFTEIISKHFRKQFSWQQTGPHLIKVRIYILCTYFPEQYRYWNLWQVVKHFRYGKTFLNI